jgi:lipopolysaccharide biosynthesis glycosyltransferase
VGTTQDADTIQVVLVADGNYAMPLSVTVCSAALHCDPKRSLRFTVFHSRFPEDLRNRVDLSLERSKAGDARIKWCEMSEASFADLPLLHSHISAMTYGRLMVPDLLSDSIDRYLYLDSDILVVDDISRLWVNDLDGRALLAARDRIGTVSGRGGLVNYRELGIPSDTKYFNAGVLLVNACKWRENQIGTGILAYLRDKHDLLQLADQEGLNAVLHDDWGELEFRWNWQIVPDLEKAKEAGCWGLELTEKSIIHYVTPCKPWVPGARYPERELYFRYVDRTAWAGWRVPLRRELLTNLKRRVRRALPKTG